MFLYYYIQFSDRAAFDIQIPVDYTSDFMNIIFFTFITKDCYKSMLLSSSPLKTTACTFLCKNLDVKINGVVSAYDTNDDGELSRLEMHKVQSSRFKIQTPASMHSGQPHIWSAQEYVCYYFQSSGWLFMMQFLPHSLFSCQHF